MAQNVPSFAVPAGQQQPQQRMQQPPPQGSPYPPQPGQQQQYPPAMNPQQHPAYAQQPPQGYPGAPPAQYPPAQQPQSAPTTPHVTPPPSGNIVPPTSAPQARQPPKRPNKPKLEDDVLVTRAPDEETEDGRIRNREAMSKIRDTWIYKQVRARQAEFTHYKQVRRLEQ